MDDIHWLLLVYKVPSEPTSRRVSLWRRLKGLGAVYLQSGVCLLPATDDHLRRLKIIENEIGEIRGECILLRTHGLDAAQHAKVVERFKADRDDEYREFLGKCEAFQREIEKEIRIAKFTYAELEEEDAEFRKLENWLEKIRKLDFHGADLGALAGERLARSKAMLDDYARRVFEAHDENRPAPEDGRG
ncbi:Chromate resistance protein ChrB [Amaricoccus solimangrovi]|uniref:Chromate resistance protein ChrB n=1 Tax=Amaricoccus solimangrovi TaxID=2589815 RepID=A0A501WYC9_9RHOB|nr:Chromate resistance protein ChrB [Amaricoccus solimangrovi]TPE53772.1 chromate resistance protein ChrB [Amaricoccus solimangrovi]